MDSSSKEVFTGGYVDNPDSFRLSASAAVSFTERLLFSILLPSNEQAAQVEQITPVITVNQSAINPNGWRVN